MIIEGEAAGADGITPLDSIVLRREMLYTRDWQSESGRPQKNFAGLPLFWLQMIDVQC